MPKDRDTAILHQSPEPPEYLVGKILRCIAAKERRGAFHQMIVSSVLFLASSVACTLSVVDLGTKLSRSGFLSFTSLFSSDFAFAIANFRELTLSLAESFPAISAAFFIVSATLALGFGARLIKEAAIIHRSKLAA